MLAIVPIRGDAGAQRVPWATVGLIAANVAVAALLGFPGGPGDTSAIDSWVLRYGKFNPVTWISAAFTHRDWFHVLSNMVGLWAFGLVAEALVGWRRFLLLYLAIAAAACAVAQCLMLGASQGGAVGASGAVMGVMAASALWAPRSRLKVFVWILVIIRIVEVEVLRFCAFVIGLQVLWVVLRSFAMNSAMLHVLGAGAGLAAGLVMLNHGWVDAGGWDYLSLRRHGPPNRPRTTRPATSPEPRVVALVAARDALAAGRFVDADDAYSVGQRASPGWTPPAADLERLIQGLRAQSQRDRAIARLEEYLRADPTSTAMSLALAEEHLAANRPTAARERLEAMDPSLLSDRDREAREALLDRSRERTSGGTLELE